MTSKRKRRRQRKKPEDPSSPVACAALAHQALEAGNYRDAVIHFKVLLKVEDADEPRAGLAAAYRGRARELAAKGMLKEALAIWDNRSRFCPCAMPDPEHFRVLVQTGRPGEAIRGYRRVEKTADNEVLSELRCMLAALYIAGGSSIEEELPDDDPIIVHGVHARGALSFWCDGDDLAAGGALAKIPFRSPYRDWVLVLKALMKWPADTAGAGALLQRVPAGSAFSPLARAAGLALLPDAEFTDALAHAGEATYRFAATLRGWTETRLALYSELKRLGEHPAANGLAKTMHRHRNSLGEEWVQHHGIRLLLDRYPESLSRSPIATNTGFTPFHQDLIGAWHEEDTNDPWAIVSAWEGVIQHLRHPHDPSPGSDDALRIALIQRRLETKWHLLNYPDDPWDDESLSQRVLDQFEESLHFDPDDTSANIHLIAHYRTKSDLKQARRVLEQALTRWPDDVNVLGEALATAVAGGAYKKAASYAHRILALDPINKQAIGSLLEAHLSHARKQLRKARPDLVERELEAAAQWARGEKATAKLECLHGILLFDNDAMAGTATLHGVVQQLGGGLNGQLVLALELARLDRPVGKLMKKLGITKIAQPDKADLLCFLRALREAMDTHASLPREVVAYFLPALQRAAGLELTLKESEMACETLQRCGLEKARLAHARIALKRWPSQPIFELHAIEARLNTHQPVTEAELKRLEIAWERAREEGDTRTAHRISELLQDFTISPPPRHLLEEPPEELRELIDEVGIEGIMEAFEAIIGGGVPEEILNDDDLDVSPRRADKTRKPRRKKHHESNQDKQLGLFE